MNDDLRRVIYDRLQAGGALREEWSNLVLAACDGRGAIDHVLQNGAAVEPAASAQQKETTAAYLKSVTVEGFRGIGPEQTLAFEPGAGLTIVVGRNGSGKSSFAEALEVLFTGDSKRWSERSKIWQEGWRNLHQPHPTSIEVDMLLDGKGRAKVSAVWQPGAPLEEQKVEVQPHGKPKTTPAALGWDQALEYYRPFLSYNELGSLLDEGPSKLYDALSLVLGLEVLVGAQKALADSRLERKKLLKSADDEADELIQELTVLLAQGADTRAATCLAALKTASWKIDAIEDVLAASVPSAADPAMNVLTNTLALEPVDSNRVNTAVAALRQAAQKLKAVVDSDAETARQTAELLEAAIAFHAAHGDVDCPVCGNNGALNEKWASASAQEVERLRTRASESERAHRFAESAVKNAHALTTRVPEVLAKLSSIGIAGAEAAREQWDIWQAGSLITDLERLATHLEKNHQALSDAIEAVRKAAASELQRREDRWRPIAIRLSQWITPGRKALEAVEQIPHIEAAEDWLKSASVAIRNERFAPIAQKAMATWEHLRQQSNVTLGQIQLTGTGPKRRVALDVTVDGVAGAALGVMSQGELHSLALSLFLPRATLAESPFRFVVIDDPVQSMDPARVDGLAKALEDTARTRQVIVFTHDERLPEAVRRLRIKSTILSITRRPNSVIEVRRALDPVEANIEDALALVHTADLPQNVLRRVVPGFCRSALEAAFISVFRQKRLASGQPHGAVDEELKNAGKLTQLAALALFNDREKGGEVMSRLNKFGGWAADVFKQVNVGAHEEVSGDLNAMVNNTRDLAEKILELK
jgi:recombinational DNA repair ATPase RecF/cation transport regulator ChaB